MAHKHQCSKLVDRVSRSLYGSSRIPFVSSRKNSSLITLKKEEKPYHAKSCDSYFLGPQSNTGKGRRHGQGSERSPLPNCAGKGRRLGKIKSPFPAGWH